MAEIHIRGRQLIIIIILFVVILLFVANRRHADNCSTPAYHSFSNNAGNLPKIYAITPTYYRPVQKAELTRLSHLVMLVPNLHWIIIEDADQTSSLVTNLLSRAGLTSRSTQLSAKTPTEFKLKNPNWSKPRGVEQRNLALRWIRENTSENDRGIVYFMDDDNAYSIELFAEMNKIQPGRVGVWPVGLVGGLMVEKPLLDEDNKVKGFNAVWRPERPFPIDMAGFAISLDLLHLRPEAMFTYEVDRGYQESEILKHLTILKELQPLANLCKEVLVWHTRTEKPKLTEEEKLRKSGKSSFDGMEV